MHYIRIKFIISVCSLSSNTHWDNPEQAGLTAGDVEIADWLRKNFSKKNIILVVNKCESPSKGLMQASEFWSLGWVVYHFYFQSYVSLLSLNAYGDTLHWSAYSNSVYLFICLDYVCSCFWCKCWYLCFMLSHSLVRNVHDNFRVKVSAVLVVGIGGAWKSNLKKWGKRN